ncbi:MAG: hypothetical protein IPP14_14940 [Planctomycetes bacterium]|nr:hypothetical protein [Planctomycetota bacterium]
MVLRLALLALLLPLLASAALAQGMSEDYVRERTRAKYQRPYGLSIEWDLLGYGALFDQQQKVRANGLPADRIGFVDDAGGAPIGAFLDTELRVRWSWNDSIEAGYSFQILRAFDDTLDEVTRFNGVTYPKGVDSDFGSDWHDMHLTYRRDLFRIGLADSFTLFALVGLEWGVIKTHFGSDTFSVQNDRDEERMRELLPWYTAGLGMELQLGESIRLTASGRGTYEVGVPTFQRRQGDDMKQSIISITGLASLEWAVTDWFSLILRAKYRYLKAKLYGGFRSDQFLWWSAGPEIGVGFRF